MRGGGACQLARPNWTFEAASTSFEPSISRDISRSTTRGYQGADWNSQFPVAQVASRFRELLDHPLVRQLFSRDFILSTVAARPDSDRALSDPRVIELHRNQLLGALGTADWIAVNFPEG